MFKVPLPDLVGEENQARGKAQHHFPHRLRLSLYMIPLKGLLVSELEWWLWWWGGCREGRGKERGLIETVENEGALGPFPASLCPRPQP